MNQGLLDRIPLISIGASRLGGASALGFRVWIRYLEEP